MTRRLLLAALSSALGLLVLLGPVTAPTAAAPGPPPVAAGDEAFSDIAGCISTADNVLVSLVVDESLSLRDTDPDDLRVQGITTAIDSLQALSQTLGGSARLHVSLSTFARDFDTLVDWRRLDAASAADAARRRAEPAAGARHR